MKANIAGKRKASHVRSVNENQEPKGASEVLEAFSGNTKADEPQYILTGKNVIRAMDEEMTDMCIPFEFTSDARETKEGYN